MKHEKKKEKLMKEARKKLLHIWLSSQCILDIIA